MRSVTGLPHGRAMADVAERQMRNWALDLQTRQQLAEEHTQTNVPQLISSVHCHFSRGRRRCRRVGGGDRE